MLTLIPESGAEQITTFQSVFGRPPSEVDVVPILSELGWGRAVKITLADGTRARLRVTAAQPELDLDDDTDWPVQTVTVPAGDGRQPLELWCKVLVELDVAVQCRATDEVEAERLIQDVFRGHRKPPKDFQPVFDEAEVKAFMARLRAMFETGNIACLLPTDVIVTGSAEPLRPPRLPEYRP